MLFKMTKAEQQAEAERQAEEAKMEMKAKILTCINEDGTMKLCGRQACHDLLLYLESPVYGSLYTDTLNVEKIYELLKSLED